MEKKCAMEKIAIRIGYSMFDTCLLVASPACHPRNSMSFLGEAEDGHVDVTLFLGDYHLTWNKSPKLIYTPLKIQQN